MSETDLPPPIGPNYDPKNDVVILGQFDFQQPQTMDRRKLTTSNDGEKWEPVNAGYMPRNTIELFSSPDLGVIAVTGIGDILRLSENPIEAAKRSKDESQKSEQEIPAEGQPTEQADEEVEASTNKPRVQLASSSQQFEFESDMEGSNILNLELFKKIVPIGASTCWTQIMSISNPSNNEIAIYRHGNVSIFEYVDGQYKFACEISPDLQVDASMTAWILYRGNTILIALGNGEVITIARDTFKELNTYTPETQSAIRALLDRPMAAGSRLPIATAICG